MSSKLDTFAEVKPEDHELYRTVSKAAVFSVILAVLSFLSLIFPQLIVLALASFVLGLMALVSIGRHPEEFTGLLPAYIGTTASVVIFIVSVSLHTYIYMTEVPPGYVRITFSELQPEERSPLPISSLAQKMDGESVFIKGYVHPGVDGQGYIKSFVLVRDMGTCCFGGQPKMTDMIEVTLQGNHQIRYSTRRRKLGGILRVSPERRSIGGIQGGFYKLEADFLK